MNELLPIRYRHTSVDLTVEWWYEIKPCVFACSANIYLTPSKLGPKRKEIIECTPLKAGRCSKLAR